jgi:fluoroquinolone transport system permease protein
MNGLRAFEVLGPIDLHGVWRDSLLRWLLGFALTTGILLRLCMPPLSSWIVERHDFDLQPYLPLVMSSVLLVLPMIVGMIIGFLLLDERDDQTLTALQVTPLPLSSYLAYRLGMPVFASVLLTVVVFEVAGVGNVHVGELLLAGVAAAPLAPLSALYFAGFANNKVQGFALAKANGFLTIPPLVAWFIGVPYEYLCGIVPTYWPAKFYWQLAEGTLNWWLFAAAIAFQFVVVALLLRRLQYVMGR